ncbi:MAG TPA: translocation/assembly module TamB domain-containing protein [Candidatus Dormibacteraeota bacterium]|nr:translocation/assembly module TamB domain-containing protein [Candidatus Dormibacteraeota bacterium]
MSDTKRKFGLKHGVALVVSLALIIGLALAYVITTGLADLWARRMIVEQLEKSTGAKVQLGSFHFDWRKLSARFDGLTLHGREPAGTPPLFHADQLQFSIRVESLWGPKISLGNLDMSHFSVHVRVNTDGSTNVPGPKVTASSGRLPLQGLFDLKIARLRITDGEILWNDTRTPLSVKGGQFEFAMDYADEGGKPVYLGRTSWHEFEIAALKDEPFASDVTAHFTIKPDSFSLTQLQWKTLHTEIDAQANLASFLRPAWNFRYRGQIRLEDLWSILRKRNAPGGHVEFTGEGRYDGKQVSASGRYTADRITMKYVWFHPGNVAAHGSYRLDRSALDLPDFEAMLLGGTVDGHVRMDIPKLTFRADTKAHGLELSRALAAEDNPSLPIIPLHWESQMEVDATTTWVANFKHVDSRGSSVWTPSAAPAPGEIPAAAHFAFHYTMDGRQFELSPGEITTPSSRIEFRGALSMVNSSLDATVDTQDVSHWDDFINRLRGLDKKPEVIAGQFHWQGQLTGPLDGPTFAGHVTGSNAKYGTLYWDQLEAELTYSPDELHLERGRASRGRSSAELELMLDLDDWAFTPDSPWSFDVSLVGANTDDLQHLLGTSYPAHAQLTGQFHAKGTRANPEFSGLFDLSNATTGSWRFDSARGQLAVHDGEVRISNAEVHMPPRVPNGPTGLLTGNIDYHMDTHNIAFDIAGAGIPLESIRQIQNARLPMGGQLNLQVQGQGPIKAPEMHAKLRLIDLKLGNDVVGSFDGKVDSDGHHLIATIGSAMTTGKLSGKMDMTLGGDYPVTAEATAERIDFDPFIASAMHISKLNGHSLVDGHFAVAGFAARPATLAVEATLSRFTFDFEKIELENVGPVRLTYRQDEIRVEQANLRGADTDFRLSGSARFAGDRALNLRLDGAVSLQLLGGFMPQLEASGHAQINAAVTGTMSVPRFNGKVHLEKASLRYGDFPAGLSNVAGDFNFNANHMVFENVVAESGGGHLTIGGTVTYGEGPLSYVVNVRSDQIRVRYPVGMSWLMAGNLRLAGGAQAATLSGRIVVDRLLMAEGFDLASFMGSSKEPVSGPSTTSQFLQNLQFDIQGDSSPDSRMEWTGARIQTDASLRLRGTWEHPILLGHIHLLSGEMNFRGNQYTISRGDINFANPFRLIPVLNVEATTTIRQYDVTLDFSGPASRLTLAYRSDPPLPSSDIIELLALGQTSQESAQRTATGQNAGVGASTLLSEAISSQLGGRIERLFGISHFRVGPSLEGLNAQQNSIASVTIEQQVAHNLVITYITDVTTTQYQVIQIEYTINREFSIVALRDENGTFGLDVVRKTRFK